MAQTTAELLIAEGMEKGIAEGSNGRKKEGGFETAAFPFSEDTRLGYGGGSVVGFLAGGVIRGRAF